MKKLVFVLLFICSATKNGKAQFVTIPDSVFAYILDSVLAPCMNGNRLDTTCPTLLNTTYFQNVITGIKDLTGIQYFKNLNNLQCSTDTALIFIPALPPHLQYFSFANTHLSSLPPLPVGLNALYCRYNWLDSLPALPDSLTGLDCSNNRLHSLPALPPHLPGLTCGGNMLDSLPVLPASLQTLGCDFNRLKALPALPAGFLILGCSHNQLASLPTLPGSIGELYCDHNQLTDLPSLPAYLNVFSCGYNYHLSCLPELGYIGDFRWDSTDIRCLPDTDQIVSSVPPLSSVPLCRSSNPNACLATAIHEISYSTHALHCYPSPTSGAFTIDMSGYDGGDRQIHIYNQLGQMVFQTATTQDRMQVDTNLASGLYTVQVVQGTRRDYTRILKE